MSSVKRGRNTTWARCARAKIREETISQWLPRTCEKTVITSNLLSLRAEQVAELVGINASKFCVWWKESCALLYGEERRWPGPFCVAHSDDLKRVSQLVPYTIYKERVIKQIELRKELIEKQKNQKQNPIASGSDAKAEGCQGLISISAAEDEENERSFNGARRKISIHNTLAGANGFLSPCGDEHTE